MQSRDPPRPAGDIAMPLGKYLLQSTRDKILRGEYIDFFSLLYQEVEKKDKGLMDKEKEDLKKRKVGFLIYACDGSRFFPVLGHCVLTDALLECLGSSTMKNLGCVWQLT